MDNQIAGDSTTSQEDIAEKDIIADEDRQEIYDGPLVTPEMKAKRKAKDYTRTKKWLYMISHWKSFYHPPTIHSKLKERVRKGIPDSLRGKIWFDVSGAKEIEQKYPILSDINIDSLDIEVKDQIERDIDRTFPHHDMFANSDSIGQIALRQLLQYYAVLDPEVGYCQGMGFIAALFLTYMSEEQAFYVFYAIMNRSSCPLRLLYLPKLIETQKLLYVYEELCRLHISKLWSHFEQQGMHPSMFFTEWAMTFYCRGFYHELSIRYWDIFLLEGHMKICYRMALGILKAYEEEFLTMKFEQIMGYLRQLPKILDLEKVFVTVWKIPLRRAQIKQLETKFETEILSQKK